MRAEIPRIICCVIGLTILSTSVRSEAQVETVLYHFKGAPDGANPAAALVADGRGNLYGTTKAGGNAGCFQNKGCGTVFELSPPSTPGGPWNETVLYTFLGPEVGDGGNPISSVIFDGNGNLYGTTPIGGAASAGAVFELTPPANGSGQWSEIILYSFKGSPDGESPEAGLRFDQTGNLYGTTSSGGVGSCNCGTVFELSPSEVLSVTWNENILHSFAGPPTDGGTPTASLVADPKGRLYGSTLIGPT